jgi:hypothetical protein
MEMLEKYFLVMRMNVLMRSFLMLPVVVKEKSISIAKKVIMVGKKNTLDLITKDKKQLLRKTYDFSKVLELLSIQLVRLLQKKMKVLFTSFFVTFRN